jgi:hypothetical protein
MATIREKEIITDWPIEEGLILGTTKIDGREINLIPETSSVPKRYKAGL